MKLSNDQKQYMLDHTPEGAEFYAKGQIFVYYKDITKNGYMWQNERCRADGWQKGTGKPSFELISIKEVKEPLSAHEQHMCDMLVALMRGEELEVKGKREIWRVKTGIVINTSKDLEYRLKPKKQLNIPWDVIDDKYKFAAMDKNGNVAVSQDKQRIIGNNTYWSADFFQNVRMLKIDTDGINWKDSLVKRP